MVDATWIVAGAGVLGVSAWLYSKTTSPESGDDDTGDSSLSDSGPRWGSRSRTNWQWLAPSAMFSTSCGWSPEEELCPEAIVAEANCSAECLRPYLQTGMDLTQNRQSQTTEWFGGTAGQTPDLGGWDPRKAFCFQGQPLAQPLNGQALRVRAVYPATLARSDTEFFLEVQIFQCVSGCGVSALYSEIGYGWGALPSWAESSLVWGDITLRDASAYSVSTAFVPTGANSGYYSDSGLEVTLVGSRTTRGDSVTRYRVKVDSTGLGSGAVQLSASAVFNRLVSNLTASDIDDACEFNSTIDISVSDFFFVDAREACASGCPRWVADRYSLTRCSATGCATETVSAPSWVRSLWTDPAAAAEYPTYQGATAEAGTTVQNAETRFPRNGFMVF